MADDEQVYTIVGVDYQRIRYGDEKRFGADWHTEVTGKSARRCHDCQAAPGDYHVPGCDMEECPRCGGQSISCDCEDEELPYLRAEIDRLRAREAAATAIVNDLIHMAREPFVCAGCGAEWPLGQNHKPDCAITRGYAWIDARTPQE